jgi:hypothetical protein
MLAVAGMRVQVFVFFFGHPIRGQEHTHTGTPSLGMNRERERERERERARARARARTSTDLSDFSDKSFLLFLTLLILSHVPLSHTHMLSYIASIRMVFCKFRQPSARC